MIGAPPVNQHLILCTYPISLNSSSSLSAGVTLPDYPEGYPALCTQWTTFPYL